MLSSKMSCISFAEIPGLLALLIRLGKVILSVSITNLSYACNCSWRVVESGCPSFVFCCLCLFKTKKVDREMMRAREAMTILITDSSICNYLISKIGIVVLLIFFYRKQV